MKKISAMLVVMLMIMISMVPAFAVESPQATTFKYNVIIIPSDGGDGTFEFVTDIDENGDQHVQLEPKPKPGYEFERWEIEGPYTPNGSLTDENLDITIRGDVTVIPYFKNAKGEIETGTINIDHSPTSPQTGAANDALPYAIIILAVAACGAAAIKLVKSK